ncbi:MAG: hypothetical protein ACR2QF_10995, partial [Geminicoccaceae bacterium]
MTRYEADVTSIDGEMVVGPKLSVEVIDGGEPPPPDTNGELKDLIEAAAAKAVPEAVRNMLRNLPDLPADAVVDARDRFLALSNDQLASPRFRNIPGTADQPGQGPSVITARTGEADITAKPFNAKSGADATKAIEDAVDHVAEGGVVYLPPGDYKCAARLPATKSFIMRGASPWATNLRGLPGRDIINVDRGNQVVQRRTGRRNRHMYENLGFWLNVDKDRRGSFNRKSGSGWRVANACIAYEEGQRGDGKHDAWCNSYGLVKHCLFSQQQKSHAGGTAIYFGSVHYGWTFEDIEIGEHGSNIAGTAGGIIDGVPSWGAANTEMSSDSNYYHRIRHWNPALSLSLLNQANSSIGNVEIYH